MNVSFTRARSKLIIIGSRKTLQSAPLLSEFFTLMDSKKWILPLPPNADKMHSHAVQPIILQRGGIPGKRPAMEEETKTIGKENDAITRPTKKIKKARTDVGVLRGRPILQDIMIGGN
jgi:DNA replication ATP-dependent helicase Dna2